MYYNSKSLKKTTQTCEFCREKINVKQNAHLMVIIDLLENFKQRGCIRCTEAETKGLQIDHIDPLEKKITVTSRTNRSIEVIESELRICQVLCWPCHKEKTAEDKAACDEKHYSLIM